MPHAASALTIEQQHLAILACCDELLAALHLTAPIGNLGQIRTRLAGLLQANLASEEDQLARPLRRLPVDGRPRGFTDITQEAAALRSRYSDHVGRWTPTAIGQDKAAYARASIDLIAAVKAHLQRKRAVLPDWRRALPAPSGA